MNQPMPSVDVGLMVDVFRARYSPSLVSFERSPRDLEEFDSDASPIDVETVVDSLSGYEKLQENGGILLPLHEPDSAELTGEYALYKEELRRTIITYHKSLVSRDDYLFLDQASKSEIGWRLRFWTDAYDPPGVPSFMPGGDTGVTQSPLEVVPERLGADNWDHNERDEFFSHLTEFVTAEKTRARQESIERYERFDQWAFQTRDGGLHEAIPVYLDESASPMRWYVSAPADEEADEDEYICAATNLWEGTTVMIDTPPWAPPSEGLPALGKIVDSETRELTFTISEDAADTPQTARSLRRIFDHDEFVVSLYPIFNPLPYDRELDCIGRVQQNQSKRDPIAWNSGLSFTPERALDVKFPELNESQTLAAYRALAADDIALIHGPPGTGKTRTLVAVIKDLVDRGQRVLACAHSNQATDNMVVGGSTLDEAEEGSLRAAHLDGDLKLARVGSGSENPVVQQDHLSETGAHADVVGATMSAAAEFDTNQFDVAVVDEASQASIPATFAPYLAADSMVLAGDHKQLPPYGSDEMRDREIEVSLYEHLVERYGEDCAELLDTQYRMHEQIAAFPSAAFYGGRVQTADRGNDSYTLWDLDPVVAHHVDGTETTRYGTSYANSDEARVIARHVRSLRERGVPASHIGIITGYTGQIQTIREALNSLDADTDGIEIDTVDSFQGGERTVILLSFVRSNEAGRSGFLSLPDVGPRRLNVALTRAQKHLVVVGNWDTLVAPEPSREDCSDLYKAYRSWLLENNCFATLKSLPVFPG